MMVATLLDKDSTPENIKVALDIVKDNKWTLSCTVQEKLLLWPALIKIPVIDRPVYNTVLDEIHGQLTKMNNIERDETEDATLMDFARQWWNEMPRDGVWEEWRSEEKIEWGKNKRIERLKQAEEDKEKLVTMLLDLYHDKDIHRLRNKLARTMLWKCQRAKANVATIKACHPPLQ